MPQIPTPIRAALGLAATAVAEARKLPETLPQLPVAAVSTAMQASLRVQQHIATLAARGDEVISQLRGTSAEPPAWATFDDAPTNAASGATRAAFDRAEPANFEDIAADLDGAAPGAAEPAHTSDTAVATSGEPSRSIDRPGEARQDQGHDEGRPDDGLALPADASAGSATAVHSARTAPGKVAPTKVAAKAAAKKAPAKKAAAKAPAKKAAAKKAAKRSEPLAEAARKADPASGPNPSTMAAEILQAHQDESPGQS